MNALAVLLLETFSCLGFGAAVLRVLKLDAGISLGEHWALSFAVGFGVLGWLLFPLGIAGHLVPLPLTLLLTLGCAGTPLLPRPRGLSPSTLNSVGRILLMIIGIVLVFDLAEALAPPADADTLAYHFPVPKGFLKAGRIDFIPEPLVGAVPLLVQMTYVPALGLGGEAALTLWTMLSGWMAAALLYVLCRRHLEINWSLALTVVFLTTPAVIYGAGTGQVETRIAMFVMVAAWATARALETGQARYAALAGVGSGFFAAAKYTGLLFVAAAGIAVVLQRRWLRTGAAFAAAAAAAGFQWYAWNAIHTGDPVFPALFQWLGRQDFAAWDRAHDTAFKEILFSVENPLPRSLLWFLLFPFKATLQHSGLPDAGRVGFGPYWLLIAPFALLSLWRYRVRVLASPLFAYSILAFTFYALWFVLGGSQRIRHLLPILPLFLLPMTVAAVRYAADGPHRKPLLGALAAVTVLQFGIHGLHALNYFRHLAAGLDRQAFLTRNVIGYDAVSWINRNLKPPESVFIERRELRYYLAVPSFLGTAFQALIELRPDATDVRKLHHQLRRVGLTHLLLAAHESPSAHRYNPPLQFLHESDCLEPVQSFEIRSYSSRTLPTLDPGRQILELLKLKDESCLR